MRTVCWLSSPARHLPALFIALSLLMPPAQACSGTWSAKGVAPTGMNGPAGHDALRALGVDATLAEIVHSPAGAQWAVNASDGGAVGTWDVRVFSGTKGKPVELTLHPEVQKAAASFPRCEQKEDPNFALAAWLKGGTEMLIVAEVPPHSSCTNMGALRALRGLRVSTQTGRLLAQLPEAALRRKWERALGCRLVPH